MRMRLLFLSVALSLTVSQELIADVTGWRGDGSGNFAAARPPTEWAKDKNIRWKTELPQWSNASPAIAGNKIFVCYEVCGLACINRTDGKILWSKTNELKEMFSPEDWELRQKRTAELNELKKQSGQIEKQRRELQTKLRLSTEEGRKADDEKRRKHWERQAEREKQRGRTVDPYKAQDYGPLPSQEEIQKLETQLEEANRQRGDLHGKMREYRDIDPPRLHRATGYSTPTPLTDGKHVWAVFGTGIAVCYDVSGSRKWIKYLGRHPNGSGMSTSPVLVGNKLIVFGDQLKALDTATGEELWVSKQARTSTGSLVTTRVGGRDVVVAAGGDVVLVEDGTNLARGVGRSTFASPVATDGFAYFADPQVKAVELAPDLLEGQKPKSPWVAKVKSDRYYASPLVRDGILYTVTRYSILSAVDIETGEKLWEQDVKLGGNAYSSITSAGDYLYVSSETGKTAVIKLGKEFELVRVNSLGEGFRSTPVFDGRELFIRGMKHLYCIAQ